MTLSSLDWLKITLKGIKYVGGAIGVSSTFMEGHPYFASIMLILAGASSEILTFIMEKEIKQ